MSKNICSVVLWLAMSLWAGSETYYVATNGVDTRTGTGAWTNAVLTISNAVVKAAAADDNTVLVSNGTYILTAEIAVTNGAAVRSLNGYANTIVDGNYPLYSNRCFKLTHTNAVLDGFTITNGCATNSYGGGVNLYGLLTNCLVIGNRTITNLDANCAGGGVGCVGGKSRIYNCRIIGNISGSKNTYRGGGGVFAYNGEGWVCNSEIISNKSETSGGGLYGGFTILNCVVTYNTATNIGGASGGGIGFNYSSGGQVIDSTIAMNIASNTGGGINFDGSSTMRHCNVYGNTSLRYGAGISTYSADYTLIDRCSISNNVARGNGSIMSGGGINAGTNSSLFRNCLIAGNTMAFWGGGGIYSSGNATIQSCTIAGNSASNNGGGIMLAGTNNLVVNAIIWSNITTSGSSPDVYNTTAEQSNSYSYCDTSITLPDASNITNNPAFVDSSAGNYRLNRGSPCIGSGTNQDWMTNAVDLDGRRRLDKFNGAVDMGAYELIPEGTVYGFY